MKLKSVANRHIYSLLCFCLGLCKKWSVRHVCIVYSPNQPIAVCWLNYPVVIYYTMIGYFSDNTIDT